MDHPLQWKNLCLTILKKCILLPIECKDLDMALTIFSTLNDRGLPLADSDIFKAQIYSTLSNIERTTFTEDWKNLTCSGPNEFGMSARLIDRKNGQKLADVLADIIR